MDLILEFKGMTDYPVTITQSAKQKTYLVDLLIIRYIY